MPKMRLRKEAGRLAFSDGKEIVRMRPGQVENVPKEIAERYAHKLESVSNNAPADADRVQNRVAKSDSKGRQE